MDLQVSLRTRGSVQQWRRTWVRPLRPVRLFRHSRPQGPSSRPSGPSSRPLQPDAVPDVAGVPDALHAVNIWRDMSGGLALGVFLAVSNAVWGVGGRYRSDESDGWWRGRYDGASTGLVDASAAVGSVGVVGSDGSDDSSYAPTACEPVPEDARQVWEAAWRPVRTVEAQDVVRVAWAEAMSSETWVGAIDPLRVVGLLRVCLEEVEREVSEAGQGGADIDIDDVDGLLVRAARRAASRWLGYVPGMLQDDGGSPSPAGATETQRVALLRVAAGVSQRGVLYSRVIRMLRGAAGEAGAADAADGRGSRRDTPPVPVSWVSTSSDVTGPTDADADAVADASSALYRIAPAILHDMAMKVADHVCGAYVQDAVAGDLSKSSLWPVFLDPGLVSTRDIQGFVNRLYLRRLVDEYIGDIVDVYEDVLPLSRLVVVDGVQDTMRIRKSVVRTRRAQELAALRGAKYVVSLLVETVDVARPMMGVCRRWLAGVVSWVLREVVGRGIGFVWEGMRRARDGSGSGTGNGIESGNSRMGGKDQGLGTATAGETDGRGRDEAWPGAGVFV